MPHPPAWPLPPADRLVDGSTILNLRALRDLQGGNRVFAFLLLIAIPVGIFHVVSGRYGNGMIAFGAALLGAIVLALDLRQGRTGQFDLLEVRRPPEPEEDLDEGEDWLWEDELLDDLDRVTDEPLPAPFQSVIEELRRRQTLAPGDDEEHAPSGSR